METWSVSVYAFGDWKLDPSRYQLSRGERRLPLRPKTFRVLQHLLMSRGRTVGKAELLDVVWRGSLVDESVLSQCIGELRRIFNDDPHNPHFIETIPRIGYRFVAIVREISAYLERLPSVAVLPFADMSPSQDQAFFCDGIAEQIISRLAQTKAFRVAARTSSFRFRSRNPSVREIGERLDVEAIVEGSIRRAGNRIRIAVQLIRVADGFHLWSAEYDGSLGDIFDFQDEVSMKVVEGLQVELSNEQQAAISTRSTSNEDAYFAYLKGRHHLQTLRNFDDAIGYFQKAISADPGYGPPYAGLAALYGNQMVWDSRPRGQLLPKMKAAATMALELDPTSAETHFALCFLKAHQLERQAAETEGRLAIELNPSLPEAYAGLALCSLSLMGRHEEAVATLGRALQVDPLSAYSNYWMGVANYLARNNPEAIHYLKMALELDSEFALAHWYLGQSYLEEKRLLQANEHFAVIGYEDHPYVLARLGRTQQARELLEGWKGDRVAQARAALHDIDLAFARLTKVYKDPMVAYSPEETALKVDPVWDPLRDDPRWGELLRLRRLDD